MSDDNMRIERTRYPDCYMIWDASPEFIAWWRVTTKMFTAPGWRLEWDTPSSPHCAIRITDDRNHVLFKLRWWDWVQA